MFIFENIYITPVESEHLPFLLDLRNDPGTWHNLGNINMLTSRSQENWLNNIDGVTKKYFIINEICEGERTEQIGLVRFDEIDYINKSIRVGADIHKNFRGRGLGSTTYKLILKYCFDYLNMNRVWLAVIDDNAVAIKLYTSAGLVVEGKYRKAIYRDGVYKDYLIMSILKDEYVNNKYAKHNTP